MTDKIYLFDTTLRDGQQTTGVNFTVSDKVIFSQALDELGIDYIEGGWPGANPIDSQFFDRKIVVIEMISIRTIFCPWTLLILKKRM